MLALEVTVPVACFRKGFAREFWETEDLPPPATCYGFLLSLVGEYDRRRHIGAAVCPALLGQPDRSTVLRTLWRVKSRNDAPGSGGNARPDYQELLTGVRLAIWIHSGAEAGGRPSLEDRVALALDHPEQIVRSGGLSLGESTHLVDSVSRLVGANAETARAFLLADRGKLTLPVWVDHVGSAGTRYVTGDLVDVNDGTTLPVDRMPRIEPH
jgi:CRISPR-associated protein Cas5t